MAKKYQATFKCYVTVEFVEDDSEDALVLADQASEKLMEDYSFDDYVLLQIEEV